MLQGSFFMNIMASYVNSNLVDPYFDPLCGLFCFICFLGLSLEGTTW
jgi:hypothetical protein